MKDYYIFSKTSRAIIGYAVEVPIGDTYEFQINGEKIK